ncbi:MAG: glutamate racemase [Treponema sp.]|jgi:glutamate racemase|nr:glutamate racemase [Treponema sp.]
MMEKQTEKRIGVLDSGLGGLTLVREMERLLPNESIVYFGDNSNCPYGNRPEEEILKLSVAMLDFLREKGIKAAAIACNTISTIADRLRERYEFPIVSIIEAACENVADMRLSKIAVFATEFTIRQGLYGKLLRRLRPETEVFGFPSRTLAALIDSCRFDDSATETEVNALLSALRESHPDVRQVLLGCTHYPIVQDIFEKSASDIDFINPAQAQAAALKKLLSERGLLCENAEPSLDICTSGEKSLYEAALKKLDIRREPKIEKRYL